MTIKVLVVEDIEDDFRLQYEVSLPGVDVLWASTIEDAEKMFAAHPDLTAIVMDACVPGYTLNTVPLVIKFRETFHGLMIANSNNREYNERLEAAGCTTSANGKNLLPVALLKALGHK